MENDYRILGVEEGADEKTIKRAYFKLIRTYSPEKEPERFQEIRAAYERLTAEKEDSPYKIDVEMPADPFAGKMLEQIQMLKRQKDYEKAVRTAEEGIRYFGEAEAFLFELARCSVMAGKTGKAVKGYEKLTQRYPDKLIYKGELAKAYYDRGFDRKALTAFREAFGAGWLETDFIMCYSQCCAYRYRPEEGMAALQALVDSIGAESRKKRMPDLTEAFIGLCGLGIMAPEKFPEIARRCRQFLEDSRRLVKDYKQEVQKIFTMLLYGALCVECEDNGDVGAVRSLVSELFPDTEDFLKKSGGDRIQIYLMMEDGRIGDLMKRTVASFVKYERSEGIGSHEFFLQMDSVLCQLEEWPKQKKELDIIEEEYKEVYAAFREFWDILRLGAEQRRGIREDIQMQYAELERKYRDGLYYELYPGRRADVPKVKWDSFESGTFSREGKKIGRNDPCPCGSGKKYKNCCMRKQADA